MEEKTVVPQRAQKSPGFAGVLGLIPFGIGAFYNGQWAKGLLYLVVGSGLISAMGHHSSGPFVPLLFTGFFFYQIFDNVQSAKAINAAAAGQAPSPAAQALPEIPSAGSIFWGIVLIVLGVGLIMANFEIISYDRLFDFWPVAVIVIGLKLVLDSVARSKNGQ
ncbi:MAG: LiaI-LiaF-like domain-containing protein [Candidatus Aminicenantales bacterium]